VKYVIFGAFFCLTVYALRETGGVDIDPMVCQGCLPLTDRKFKITGSSLSTITHLDGEPAFEVLQPIIKEFEESTELQGGHLFGALSVDSEAVKPKAVTVQCCWKKKRRRRSKFLSWLKST